MPRMNAAPSFTTPEPAPNTRQVLRAALQRLLELGERVAAASTRLAEVEHQAADALATAAIKAVAILERQDSLAAATEIGHIADICEAARDRAAARLERITATHEVASATVRKTLALALRVEDERPFRQPSSSTQPPRPASDRRPNPLYEDLSQRLDPDDGVDGKSANEVLGEIHRDLRRAMQRQDAPPDDAAAEPAQPPARRHAAPANDTRQAQQATVQPPGPDTG